MDTLDQVAYQLDVQMRVYQARLKIVDKRWDRLQDLLRIEEEAHGDETVLWERIFHVCGRAEAQSTEMEWRIETLSKAYTHLEDIEISTDKIRQDNHIRRKKKNTVSV